MPAVATLPITTAQPAAPPNAPPSTLPFPVLPGAPPRDPQARRDFLSGAVMKAVGRAVQLLDDDDSHVALAAVQEILAVEKTRMRHGGAVLGAHPPYLDDVRKELGDPDRVSVAALYDPPPPTAEVAAPPAIDPSRSSSRPLPDFTRNPDYPGGPVLSRDPAKIGPPGSAVPPWEREAEVEVREDVEEEDEKPNRMADLRDALDPPPARVTRFEADDIAPGGQIDPPKKRPVSDWLISLRE